MVKAIVTTERKCREESVALAQELSARLQIDYVERACLSSAAVGLCSSSMEASTSRINSSA